MQHVHTGQRACMCRRVNQDLVMGASAVVVFSFHCAGQRERLNEISRMSSRLGSELGPDAIRLSTDAQDLSDCLWEMHRALLEVMSGDGDGRSLAGMDALRDVALFGLGAAQAVPPLPPRREVAVCLWLTERGIDGQWAFSPAFIHARLGSRFLEDVLDAVGIATFEPVLRWLSLTIEAQLLLGSLHSALEGITARLEADVDQRAAPPTPTLVVGLHDLLSSTLALLPRRCHECGDARAPWSGAPGRHNRTSATAAAAGDKEQFADGSTRVRLVHSVAHRAGGPQQRPEPGLSAHAPSPRRR